MILGVALAAWNQHATAQDAKPTASPSSVEPRRVKVLFLGDNGHHVPLERCRDVASTMGIRGIDLVYTDDLNDLNAANLNRYDVLAGAGEGAARLRGGRARLCADSLRVVLLPQFSEDHGPDRGAVQEPWDGRVQGDDRAAGQSD
jgi:hypothetical protein